MTLQVVFNDTFEFGMIRVLTWYIIIYYLYSKHFWGGICKSRQKVNDQDVRGWTRGCAGQCAGEREGVRVSVRVSEGGRERVSEACVRTCACAPPRSLTFKGQFGKNTALKVSERGRPWDARPLAHRHVRSYASLTRSLTCALTRTLASAPARSPAHWLAHPHAHSRTHPRMLIVQVLEHTGQRCFK